MYGVYIPTMVHLMRQKQTNKNRGGKNARQEFSSQPSLKVLVRSSLVSHSHGLRGLPEITSDALAVQMRP